MTAQMIMVEWLMMKVRATNQVAKPIYNYIERKNLDDCARPLNYIKVTMPFPTRFGKPVAVACFYGVWTIEELQELDFRVRGLWDGELLVLWVVGRHGLVLFSWHGAYLSPGLYASREFLERIADLDNPELVLEIGKLLDEGKEFWAKVEKEVKQHDLRDMDNPIFDGSRGARALEMMALDLYLQEGSEALRWGLGNSK